MKKALRFIGFFLGFALFLSLILGISIAAVPYSYEDSYQHSLVRQYDAYREIQENKIVFIGGSSLAFGLNLDLMEELTGMPCALLGGHAGYGLVYPLNMSKCNLRQGDIVVIEYDPGIGDSIGSELVLSGIGNRFDMYSFAGNNLGNLLLDYGMYAYKNACYALAGGYQPKDVYTIRAFDHRGGMTLSREECTLSQPYAGEGGWQEYQNQGHQGMLDFLNSYVAYCEAMGVTVYFTIQPCLDEATHSTQDEIHNYDLFLAGQLKAPLISSSLDYLYDRTYMFDSILHCSTTGADRRTNQLFEDLSNYTDFDPAQ